jgi:SAM-dependent methyltransferase
MFQQIIDWIELQDPDVIKAWGPILIGGATIVASFVTSYLLLRTQRLQNRHQNEANVRQFSLTKSKEERDDIVKKLNNFYGPFKGLRTQSKLLYGKFAPELQTRYRHDTGVRFRTLRYLLEGGTLTGQDDEIFNEILRVGRKQLKLIETQSGVVDKPELQGLLGKLCVHIKLLQLAYDRRLSGPASRFEDIVFPLAIDGAIESAILRLQDRVVELNEHAGGTQTQNRSTIQNDCTICYYDANAEAYANKTILLDLTDIHTEFKRVVPSGRILDAGCGAGRDTRFFIENGYVVIAFDASIEMVRKCQEYPHAYCIQRSFAEITFKEEFDGVWACASLLHLKRNQAKLAMTRLTSSLKPGGVMFVSLKVGQGNHWDNGRYFEYYNDETVHSLFDHDARLELTKSWHSTTRDLFTGGEVEWLNVFLSRRLHTLPGK